MRNTPILLLTALLTTPLAWAQMPMANEPGHMPMAQTPARPMPAAADMTRGEIRKIDPAAGKVTLKHGEIKSLDMPGMTMVFTVQDKAMLAPFKAGDQVLFNVIYENGQMIITELKPAN